MRLNNAAADALARSDLDRLRSLSRKQARDNDYMLRFLQMVGNHVVGRDGFSLQMQVQLDNGSAMDNQANRAIEEAFAAWARRDVCEVSGLYSFTDLQRLMVRSVARDGEVLVRHVYGSENGHGYALQLLDIDRLDTQLNRDKQNGKNAIRMGWRLTTGAAGGLLAAAATPWRLHRGYRTIG
ncbi:phage portal protein [Neisseria subflava]|uniref:phage portal protein n=1 Tax=Neisseria subflava TaxID=28449 RepID=UPI00202AB0F8